MRWRIRNEHHHLDCIVRPIHLKRLSQRGGLRLWPITTPSRHQAREILLHHLNIIREPIRSSDIALILGRVITKRDEPKSDLVPGQRRGGWDLGADATNSFASGGDVWTLTPCGVLNKDYITRKRLFFRIRWFSQKEELTVAWSDCLDPYHPERLLLLMKMNFRNQKPWFSKVENVEGLV